MQIYSYYSEYANKMENGTHNAENDTIQAIPTYLTTTVNIFAAHTMR